MFEHLILAAAGIDFSPAVSILRALLYFVIVIFILVSIHEFGHFIAGRIFGMRVPVFSIGMGQRVFGWNKIDGLTWGALNPETEIQLTQNTDYRLSALPIGGYAKIEGMIDESTTELPQEIQPWEFRAKPWWQKTVVILAGVIMNTLLAWAVFSAHDYVTGEQKLLTTTIGGIDPKSMSKADGVLPGDKVVAVDGKQVNSWDDAFGTSALRDRIGKDFEITYSRAGKDYSVIYRTSRMSDPKDIDQAIGLEPEGFGPPVVVEVTKGMPAAAAGIQEGDEITKINGEPIAGVDQLIDRISSNAQKPITIDILRDKKTLELKVTPNADGKIGIGPVPGEFTGPTQHINLSIGQSLASGWQTMGSVAKLTVTMIGRIIGGKESPSHVFGGPIKIAQMASKSASNGLENFVMFIGLLSLSLAMLNVLPIPALDGGHLIIILVEAAIGHELSQTVKMRIQQAGVAILLTLMVFMVINDIRTL